MIWLKFYRGVGHTLVGGRQVLYYSMSGMKAPIIIAVSQFTIYMLLLVHLAILSTFTQYQFSLFFLRSSCLFSFWSIFLLKVLILSSCFMISHGYDYVLHFSLIMWSKNKPITNKHGFCTDAANNCWHWGCVIGWYANFQVLFKMFSPWLKRWISGAIFLSYLHLMY